MFTLKSYESFQIIEINLPGPITPGDLPELLQKFREEVEYDPQKGVIVSGRGPIWLYGAILHELHPTAWVGVFDPRLGGGVVVQSHAPGVEVGSIIPVEG